MTREEAKAILENDIVDGHVEGNARFMDAFWMAVDALSQEPCEDCISRQAVLDGLGNIAKVKAKSDAQKALMGRVMFFTEQLPPVTPKPKTGHWIEVAKYSDGRHEIECSKCGSHIFDRGHANTYIVKVKYKYCPRCGANMTEIPTGSESEEV